jgi:hypothetical protein
VHEDFTILEFTTGRLELSHAYISNARALATFADIMVDSRCAKAVRRGLVAGIASVLAIGAAGAGVVARRRRARALAG